MFLFFKKLLTFFCVIFILTGCSGNNNGDQHPAKDFPFGEVVFWDRIGLYEKDSFVFSFFQSSELSIGNKKSRIGTALFSSMLFNTKKVNRFFRFKTNQVTGYQVQYTTLHPYENGKETEASGLLLIPPASRPLPLLVYHHGTIIRGDQAPSLIPESMLVMDPLKDSRFMIIFLAMQGYIVLAPDYIGYGASEGIRPPYLYKRAIRQTTSSMLHAVAKKLQEENIPFKKDVFIMGYSQGGHGALAFAQGMQNNQGDFNVQAVAAGGGPYDVPDTVSEMLDKETIPRVLTVLLLQSYSYIYDLDLDNIVKRRSYADIISSAFEQESISTTASRLPREVDSLFHPHFIENVQTKKDTRIQEALEDNNVYEWAPSFPVLLFHSKEDNTVPYSNMQAAYDFFRKERSPVTKKNCNFKKLDFFMDIAEDLGQGSKIESVIKPNHINCGFIFFIETSDYFSKYKD